MSEKRETLVAPRIAQALKPAPALTVCQPYAWLISTPQDDLPQGHVQKRCENRQWPTRYRGPLWIHAGKSTAWFGGYAVCPLPQDVLDRMVYGAILCRVQLVACIHIAEIQRRRAEPDMALWLDHPHTVGPWCWLFGRDIERLEYPVYVPGQQGLWKWNGQPYDAPAEREPQRDPCGLWR